MNQNNKAGRYSRIYAQLIPLLQKSNSTNARMATVLAVLHHKMNTYFWTGFYMPENGEMTVQMYQGPLACQILEKNKGACWTSFNRNETIIIADVHQFPGHITCDSRSNSEIVVPFRDQSGQIIGVLDVDSSEKNAFDETDAHWLEKILLLIHNGATGQE